MKRTLISLQKAEYTSLFEKNQWFTCQSLFCRFQFSENTKIGWIVPKKKLKRAVDRNALKRILREHFRKNYPELLELKLHILVSIRYPIPEFNKKEFHKQTDLCFKQLIKRSKKEPSS